MAGAGANVVITSRKAEACDAAVAAIKADGGSAIAVPCNVSHLDALPDLVAAAEDGFGQVDILVGNAAANPHYGPMTTIDEAAFDKIIGTNVKANLWLAKLVLPKMAERRDGAVIFVSSIGGRRGNDDIGTYGVSKAAEEAMARNLAVGWGPHNIRINCIAPGLVRTEFARALWDDPAKLKHAEDAYPLRRIGEPEDIGGVATFLASDAARFITGQTIVVDGGITISGTGRE
jgi:NAD(P)-dependent dehydrogenase (short-subunit alcohol dehydrogenase family)